MQKSRRTILIGFWSMSVVWSLLTPVLALEPGLVVKAHNITTEYLKEWSAQSSALDDQAKAKLQEFKVLIVPGFLSSISRRFRELSHKQGFGGYFEESKHWMKKNEIEFSMAPIQSEESPEYNARIIREEIEKSEKPVIILSHSKGGVDTLQTLLDGIPHGKVVGWLSLNSPFLGSPIATLVESHNVSKYLAAGILASLGGSSESIESLMPESRAAFHDQHTIEIADIVQKTPLICFASFKEPEAEKTMDTPFWISRNYLEKQGYQNDGVVPWKSEVLEGSDYILVSGVDHTLGVRSGPYLSMDRERFTQVLFSMLLKRMH